MSAAREAAWLASSWCDADPDEGDDGCDSEHLRGAFVDGWGAAVAALEAEVEGNRRLSVSRGLTAGERSSFRRLALQFQVAVDLLRERGSAGER